MDKHLPSQKGKNIITNLAAFLFLFIATLHAARVFYGWSAQIGAWEVPVWVSGLAVLVALYLAWVLFRMDK